MQSAQAALQNHTLPPPSKMTVAQWLEIWSQEYLRGLKPGTVSTYTLNIRNHILPAMGSVRLQELHPHTIQIFINELEGLSAGSVRLIYRVLHMALEKAMQLEYLSRNPSDHCVLPRAERPEIHPLSDREAAVLLQAVRDSEVEHLVSVALFTGMRLSELLGLTWDCVDFKQGTIFVCKQLALPIHREQGIFLTPKSGKSRVIVPASSVMTTLRKQQIRQAELRLKAGAAWQDPHDLVFTQANGAPFDQWRVRRLFHALLSQTDLQGVRFHDLRHTYAVNAIRAGDDIKTIQSNLGHASAAFTLDRYGHFTQRMQQDSAQRMETFIKDVLGL